MSCHRVDQPRVSLGSGALGTVAALCASRVEKSANEDGAREAGRGCGAGGGGGTVIGTFNSPVLMSGGKSLSHSDCGMMHPSAKHTKI